MRYIQFLNVNYFLQLAYSSIFLKLLNLLDDINYFLMLAKTY